MGLSRRRWRQLLGALAILLIALGIALRSDRAGEAVCQQLRERLPGLLNAKVELGRCAIDPLTGSVRISGVSVWPEGAAAPLATADEASVALRGLFLGGVALQQVSLVRPQITVTVPATSAPRPKSTTCVLEPLSRLRVGQLEVQNGAVTVNLPEGRVVKLDGLSIDASLGRREATLQVDARGGAVALGGERPTLRIGRLSLEGSIDLLAERAEVQRADLNVEGVRVTASGLVDALCDADAPTLDLAVQTWVPLETLPRLGVSLPEPSGQLLAHGQVTGRAT